MTALASGRTRLRNSLQKANTAGRSLAQEEFPSAKHVNLVLNSQRFHPPEYSDQRDQASTTGDKRAKSRAEPTQGPLDPKKPSDKADALR